MAGDSNMGLTFVLAFVVVLALIILAAWLVRRFAGSRLGTNTNRGRMPRLAVIDAAAVDGRRRLVLVRRDNIEHLLMIGGPTDIVVEPNIVRAMPGRDQMSSRPAVAPDAAPPRVTPLPDAAWNDSEAARPEIFEEPELPPPSRPSRPAFEEMRRPAPAAERRSDPLAGFSPEPVAARPERAEPRPDPMPPRLPRAEPPIPRAPRAAEPPKMPPPLRAPERAAAPPPPPPPVAAAPAPTPPAPPPPQSNADANLAEMAQRLEAALRRPAGGAGETVAPPVAPEAPPVRAPRSEPPAAPAPAAQKSGFENLEDEMASLLGRPKTPS
jgi:flagellar protein FliO/FliZ